MKKTLVVISGIVASLTICVNSAVAINPFWAGVLQSLAAYTVNFIIHGMTNSSQNTPLPNTLTRDQARDIVGVWLQAKHQIFGSSYDRSLADQITTGRLKTRLLSSDGSLNWLINNNAYYTYGDQFIEAVEMFATSQSGIVRIQVVVYESRTLYVNNRVDRSSSATDKDSYLYTLRRESDGWKIENYEVVN